MHNEMAHLTVGTIEQLAEGLLPPAEERIASAHVESCDRCAAELEGARELFSMLSGLPRFAPPPGFGDAVMARVTIAPERASAWAWMQRWLPSTPRGWALLAGVSSIPVLSMLALLAWLLSQPMVSATTLLGWATERSQWAAHAAWDVAVGWGIGSGMFGWIQSAYDALAGVPIGWLTAVVTVLAVAIPLSAWSLVRLVRTPTGNVSYAN